MEDSPLVAWLTKWYLASIISSTKPWGTIIVLALCGQRLLICRVHVYLYINICIDKWNTYKVGYSK